MAKQRNKNYVWKQKKERTYEVRTHACIQMKQDRKTIEQTHSQAELEREKYQRKTETATT